MFKYAKVNVSICTLFVSITLLEPLHAVTGFPILTHGSQKACLVWFVTYRGGCLLFRSLVVQSSALYVKVPLGNILNPKYLQMYPSGFARGGGWMQLALLRVVGESKTVLPWTKLGQVVIYIYT